MDLWEIYKASKGVPHSGDMYDALMGKSLGGGSVWETENAPYLFRPSAGYLNSRLLGKEKDCLVGASVGWQQLVKSGDVSVSVPSGHKYYANINNSKTIGSSNGSAISINDSTKDNVVDLTLMLGSQIADYAYTLETQQAGKGVKWLKDYGFFADNYFAFDGGSIKSVSGLVSHKMVGKNLLDASSAFTNPTCYSVSDGVITVKTADTGGWETIPTITLPAGTYTLSRSNNKGDVRARYSTDDYANEVYLFAHNGLTAKSITFTEETSVKFKWGLNAGTYPFTVQAQLEFGTATDYAPYHADTYPLDSTVELRGLFKMDADHNLYADGDTYESSGVVTRKRGRVNLGDYTYYKYNAGSADNPVYIFGTTGFSNLVDVNGDIICSKYLGAEKATSNADAYAKGDKICCFLSAGDKRFYIRDDSMISGTETAFKTSLDGVYLEFELATPTTDTATPFTSPQNVDGAGTEEYITTDKFVPVGHSTEYKVASI